MMRRTLVRCATGALAVVCVLTPAAPHAQVRGGPIADLQQRVQALEQKVTDLDAALSALRTEVDNRDDALQAQITVLSGQLAGFQGQLDELNTALNAPDGVIATLQNQLEMLEQDVADLSETAGDLSLATLAGSACITPTGQEGLIEITQSKSGVAILRCRAGEGRFIDNVDGTITDTHTGLTWEKKTTAVGSGQNFGDLHDVDNRYTWNAAMGDWLDRLNGRLIGSSNEGGFAGYSDWRLATLAELRTIVDPGSVPTIDPIFGLASAERMLPRASDVWVQASLDQKQRVQQLFFPEIEEEEPDRPRDPMVDRAKEALRLSTGSL